MASEGDEKKQQPFQSGYIKMSQSGGDAAIYWATFIPKLNQLHLYDKEASLNEPEEIIYLSTCNVVSTEKNAKYVMLEDLCTGIRYKFEPKDGQINLGFVDRVNFFFQECIVDFLCQDPSQMSARQQFNRFLLHQKKMAAQQKKQLPKLLKAAKRATDCDKALKDATNWLQRLQLDDEDRKIFSSALSVRNKFWNLLIDTRDFINTDYVTASKVCGVFARWDKMSKQAKKLSPHDKKVLLWGLNQISKFTTEDKADRAQKLQTQWKELERLIKECQENLQTLQTKWQDKVDRAENVAIWCNMIGGFLAVAGIAGGLVAGAAAAGFITVTAPVWLPGAAAASFVIGATIISGGQANVRQKRKTKKTIENMQDHLDSYRHRVQTWKEAVELLEFPLTCIGLSDKAATTDYEPEIKTWEAIADHEKDLLESAATTFKKFRNDSLATLNAIRKVQDNLQ